MKKINRNMRGFTLVEIMIVVAIILIISAVAFTGVAVTLSNAQDKYDNMEDTHAVNKFEPQAWNTVRSLEAGVVDWTSIPKYTPKKKADREVAALKAFGWKDEEIEVTYGETGYVVTKTWNPDLHGGKTYDEYVAEKNAAQNKTNNTRGNSQQGQNQQGQNQPGQNQPGQDQPGQNQPGQDQPGLNQQNQNQQNNSNPPAGSVTIPSSSYTYKTTTYNWGGAVQWCDFNFSDATYDGKKVTITVTYSGNVTSNQVSNCKLVSVNGNTVVYEIDNYSHYTTNYSGAVNGDVKITNVEFSAS
jgi:prepilin-type N-terminal cleavage/methylation domain-containing protein